MIIIKHRVNNSKDLKKLNPEYGVEVDLRSNNNNIYLHHDPFKKGELFSKWIKKFNHRLIVLNVCNRSNIYFNNPLFLIFIYTV